MAKHIYQVHTRVYHRDTADHVELSEFYTSRKKAETALAMLARIYRTGSVDYYEEPAWRSDQMSPTLFFNMREREDSTVRFRASRILKVEVK